MAIYNISWMDNVSNPMDILQGAGQSVGETYLIGYMILFSFFVILFSLYAYRDDFRLGLLVASVLTTILAILLYFSGDGIGFSLIPATAIAYPLLVMVISFLLYFITR